MNTSERFPKESYDLIRHGLKVYANMTKTWLEFVARSSKGQPVDVMKPWVAPPFGQVEDVIEFSKKWQKNYHKLMSRSTLSSR